MAFAVHGWPFTRRIRSIRLNRFQFRIARMISAQNSDSILTQNPDPGNSNEQTFDSLLDSLQDQMIASQMLFYIFENHQTRRFLQ